MVSIRISSNYSNDNIKAYCLNKIKHTGNTENAEWKFKSHTTPSWVECHVTEFSRDYSTNNIPCTSMPKKEKSMIDFQKTGQKKHHLN